MSTGGTPDRVDVVVVGDGPAGLSAALFLAKNGQRTVVLGGDETAMHYAHLHNYLGVPDIGGTEFQAVARRQVGSFDAELVEDVAEEVAADGDGFAVTTEGGAEIWARYLVIAGARGAVSLAESLGAEVRDGAVVVDEQQQTTVEGAYAAGRTVRPHRSQAIVSAGAGAVAALDILSRERGEEFHDWDTPPDDS